MFFMFGVLFCQFLHAVVAKCSLVYGNVAETTCVVYRILSSLNYEWVGCSEFVDAPQLMKSVIMGILAPGWPSIRSRVKKISNSSV